MSNQAKELSISIGGTARTALLGGILTYAWGIEFSGEIDTHKCERELDRDESHCFRIWDFLFKLHIAVAISLGSTWPKPSSFARAPTRATAPPGCLLT